LNTKNKNLGVLPAPYVAGKNYSVLLS